MDQVTDITSYGQGAFKVIVVAALLIFMQSLMLGGRFISRKLRKVPLAADDYVLLIATVLTIGLCSLALACKSTRKTPGEAEACLSNTSDAKETD